MQIPATPVFAGVSTTMNVETTTEFGDSTETSKTDSISVDVFVPETSKISVSIVTSSMTSTVPYTAMLEKIFFDGTRKREKIRSQYTGVQVSAVSN